MRHRFASLVLTMGASAIMHAQAPLITPAGDPSVKNDTIYALSVNPADYRNDPYVFLLDDGVVRIEADGRTRQTYRQVVQILTQEAAEQWGEQSISYSSDRQKLTINWMRVVRPNGEVVSAKPVHEQESSAGVDDDAPVYTDSKVHRASLGGVVPGTLVDYSYTIEDIAPVMPRDFFTTWSIHTSQLVRRSRLIVDAPDSLRLNLFERNLPMPRTTTVAAGRRVMTWAARELTAPKRELFATDSNDTRYGRVLVSAPITWNDVAAWYAGLSRDRYALSPAVQQKVAEVVSGAKTLDDSLRAVHRWIAQDLRYVSLSLGTGGYQPRTPASVLETQYGDCKDKATLFIAVARSMGVEAYPVLLNSDGVTLRDHPTTHQFDHAIAAVKRPNGYLFLDLTAEYTPYGELPFDYQGGFGLVVHDNGTADSVTIPRSAVADNVAETRVVGALTADGHFHGKLTELGTGNQQYALRGLTAQPLTEEQKTRMLRRMANALFEQGVGDSLQLMVGKDLRAPATISFVIRDGKATTPAGSTQVMTIPLPAYGSSDAIAELKSHPDRKSWISVSSVSGYRRAIHEMRVTLPEGWTATLPPSVTADGIFGSYHAEYALNGRELRITRTIIGKEGVQPPSAVPSLIQWLEQVGKDDPKFIVLQQTPGGGSRRGSAQTSRRGTTAARRQSQSKAP